MDKDCFWGIRLLIQNRHARAHVQYERGCDPVYCFLIALQHFSKEYDSLLEQEGPLDSDQEDYKKIKFDQFQGENL